MATSGIQIAFILATNNLAYTMSLKPVLKTIVTTGILGGLFVSAANYASVINWFSSPALPVIAAYTLTLLVATGLFMKRLIDRPQLGLHMGVSLFVSFVLMSVVAIAIVPFYAQGVYPIDFNYVLMVVPKLALLAICVAVPVGVVVEILDRMYKKQSMLPK